MMRIYYPELQKLVAELLIAQKFSFDNATLIADHLATSDLVGHHSHGITRMPIYYQRVMDGTIDPEANTSIDSVSPTIAFIDGHNGLGQLASARAANQVVAMAKSAGLAAIGIHNIDHSGRLGAYVQQIAESGMLGIYFANCHSGITKQAPFGGIDAKLSPNPLALSAPRKNYKPIILDMATTSIAHGKVLVALQNNQLCPEDTLLDAQGKKTVEPQDYLSGGSLLPLGGNQGYKGFGLVFLSKYLQEFFQKPNGSQKIMHKIEMLVLL